MKQTSLVLMGMKHCGKSTLALLLAREWRACHVELDEMIETEHRTDRSQSCREIYREYGRDYFIRLETAAAEELAARSFDEFLVASLGGGTIENPEAMQKLYGCGRLVYLEESAETLYGRIMKNGRPAFLGPDHPFEQFLTLYRRRTDIYREHAGLVIPLEGREQSDAFDHLLEKLKGAGHAG